jgi:hypothetical protein
MIVLYEDIENIDDHPKEDLAKSGYKPDKIYNSLINLVSRGLILSNLTLQYMFKSYDFSNGACAEDFPGKM